MPPEAGSKFFEYRHVVTLEETNALGNVYFAHYLRWQGHCRELFLRDRVPAVFTALGPDNLLVTTRCSCEYFAELAAFDEVIIRMRTGESTQNRLTLQFDYWRAGPRGEELAARGEQQLAWLERVDGRIRPQRVPEQLLRAIDAYSGQQ